MPGSATCTSRAVTRRGKLGEREMWITRATSIKACKRSSRQALPALKGLFLYLTCKVRLTFWICDSVFSLLNTPPLLVGWGRRSARGVTSSPGSTDRATFHTSLAGRGRALARQPLVLPQQPAYVPCYLFPSFSQLTGARKNRETKMTLFPPKALLLANLSVLFSSCNALLLIFINWNKPEFT